MSATQGNSASDLPDKTVNLTLNADGCAVPDQDPIPVMRGQQKIKWSAPFEFQIEIENYDGSVQYKTNNGNRSFEAKSGYFSGKHHKYSIIAEGKTNDPEIVVEP
jgi:hypothetical protein